MKKLSIALIVIAVCLLLLYMQLYSDAQCILENAAVILRLSNYPGDAVPTVELNPDKIQVVFLFDGGGESVYTTAYPLLAQYGCKGSVAVIPTLVGRDGHMSYAQLAELYMDEWDILNHSYSHQEDMYAQCDEMLSEYQRTRVWLQKHFFTRFQNMVISPYGECNPYLIQQMYRVGFESIGLSENILCLYNDGFEFLPIKSIPLLADTPAETVEAELSNCGSETEVILFHLHKIISDDEGKMSYSPENLKALLEYLCANANTFEVVPYSSLLA